MIRLSCANLLHSPAPPRVLDVRTPGEFETAHIAGSYNVPLDLLREHRDEIIEHLDQDVVLVCRSGQRAAQAEQTLAVIGAGLTVAALTNTCAMGMLLARLPYNRGATCDAQTVVAQLVGCPAERPNAS